MKEREGGRRGRGEGEKTQTLILSNQVILHKLLILLQRLQENRIARKCKPPKIFLEQSEGGERKAKRWTMREKE